MRGSNDISFTDKIIFNDFEIEENDNTNQLEFNTNGTKCMTIDTNCDIVMTGDLNVSGTITGAILGSANSIQDVDNTTSITTSTIAETLIMRTNSNERMRIKSDGNVGIGTTNPTQLLHLNESGATGLGALFTNANNTTGGLFGIDNSGNIVISQGNTDDIIFNLVGIERMRIDTNGNLGIGTNTPLVRLQVENDADLNTMIVGTGSSAINRRSNIQFRSTFGSGVDTNQRRCADILTGFNAGTWGNEYMSFNVGNNGASNDSAVLTDEKMRILDSGIIQIGDNVNSGAKLDLTGLNDMLRMTNTAGEFLLGVDNLNITYMKSSNGAIKITNNSSTNTTATISVGDISGNQFVGINTETPTETLSVVGTNFNFFVGDTIGGNIRAFLRDATTPIFGIQDTGNSIFGMQASVNTLVLGALSGSNLLKGIVVDASNNVSINTTNSSGQLHIAADFDVVFVEGNDLVPGTNKLVRVENKAVEVMYIESDGDLFNTNGTYGTISDIRVKQNITVANSQWEDIKGIDFVNYELIKHPGKTLLGVKAQQVETIAPGLIKNTIHSQEINGETIENIKQVKQSVLFMKATIALQEALNRIETLEAENQDKQTKINTLETQMIDVLARLDVLEGNV